MTEADNPPVRRWADLPDDESTLAKEGFDAWRAGRLDEAQDHLTRLRRLAACNGSRDAMFHALHLLAVVAFDRNDLGSSRAFMTRCSRCVPRVLSLVGLRPRCTTSP
jgi:hypothetical protein